MNTRKIFGYGLISVILVLAFTTLSLTGCDNGTGGGGGGGGGDDISVSETNGRLTINGLDGYDGKYVGAAGINAAETLLLYAGDGISGSFNYTGSRITNGSAALKVWEFINETRYRAYAGNDTITLGISIFNSARFNLETPDIDFGEITVNFTNGIGSGTFTSDGGNRTITYTAIQTGGAEGTADSTGIVFTFSASVDRLNLTAADITVGGAASKGSAVLTGSGTRKTLSPITVSAEGTATITITKNGIEAATKNVAVYKRAEQTASGTPGLAYELINNNTAYRVKKGSVTSGEVIIPASYNGLPVTEIGHTNSGSSSFFSSEGAFNNTRITAVHIPASVTTIGTFAFYGCASLASVTIPAGVTSIGSGAFQGCTSLASITIPAGVTSINYAFAECINLTGITVDSGNTNYTSESGILYNKTKTSIIAYPSASGNVTIPASVTSIGSYAFWGCSITSIAIPAGVTSIGGMAFQGCTSLTSINIPAGVTTIGSSAFNRCINLTGITVDSGNTNYTSESGILYNKAKTTLVAYPSASGNVTIPAGVTSISDRAFGYCRSLTSITIPVGVTEIGNGVFLYCTSLTSITIPASVTEIGYDAFLYCTGLTSITIPAGVTEIGYRAFGYWTSSQTINIQGKANQSAADAAWGARWREGSNANIVYQG
jgi:hypothetical protein